jgi:hypothetical protein
LSQSWSDCPAVTAERASAHCLAHLLGLGRHTLSGCLVTQGRTQQDWSADYRAYSAGRLEPERLFGQILQQAQRALPEGPLWLATDDSTLAKSGRRVAHTAWRRDPLSPPFAVNFQWGQRVLQISLLWPTAHGPARALPVDFAVLPNAPKGEALSQLSAKALEQAQDEANVNRVAARCLEQLAQRVPAQRRWVVAVDGRFTNRTFLRHRPKHLEVVGRVRKDSALFYAPENQPATGRRRLYGAAAPTPEQLRQDDAHPWQSVEVFAAGKTHAMRIKVLERVRSRLTGEQEMRLIVIAPLAYRLRVGSKLLYRQPAYLLVSDPHLSLQECVQGYVRRWEIEVNYRDEKSLLGVGQAQVRLPESVTRVPALQVAAYSALLWAAIRTYGSDHLPDAIPLPKWRGRDTVRRPSTARLINQLRYELWASALVPEAFRGFWSAAPPDQNASKPQAAFAHAVFQAMN